MTNSDGKPVFGRRKPPAPPAAPLPAEMPPEAAAAKQAGQSAAKPHSGKHLSSSSKLSNMLRTPYDKRDGRWNHEFISLIYEGFFYELHPVSTSPDGFSVYPVCIAEKGDPGAMSFPKAIGKAAKEGWGLAIFVPGNMEPRFILTAGQITPYMNDGRLMPLSTRPSGPKGEFVLERDTPILTGAPSNKLLPLPVRGAMREWLKERYQITDTRMCLQMVDLRAAGFSDEVEMMRSIAFRFEGIFLGAQMIGDIIGQLYWFMPPDVAPANIPGLSESSFHPL